MASYNTSDFKRGLKVQIDGDPYIMWSATLSSLARETHCTSASFAIWSVARNSIAPIRGAIRSKRPTSRKSTPNTSTSKGDRFVFMDNENFEQYELTKDQTDDAWKWLKEGMVCSMVLFNNNPISVAAPNHVVLKIDYCEPAIRGNTATNLTKPVKLETGAEVTCPAFVEIGDMIKVDTRTAEYLERVRG